jgi:hypothetical protein
MNKSNEPILTLYFLRHQQSVQNKQGFGDKDTELTEQGRESASNLSQIARAVNPDIIMAGTLKRHEQTLQRIATGYKGDVVFDERLNAVFSGPLLSQPPEETQRQYNLDRFKPGKDGLCHVQLPDGREKSFDPRALGIYPFNPLYCGAYFDRDLRVVVFPDNTTLTSFDEIEKQVRSFQADLIEKDSTKPLKIVVVSSCSASGFNLEYAAFRTIGENIFAKFGREQGPVFPQDHDEVMVLGYNKKDLVDNKKDLHAVEGNIKIVKYLSEL